MFESIKLKKKLKSLAGSASTDAEYEIIERVAKMSGLSAKEVRKEFKKIKTIGDLEPADYEEYRMWTLTEEQYKTVKDMRIWEKETGKKSNDYIFYLALKNNCTYHEMYDAYTYAKEKANITIKMFNHLDMGRYAKPDDRENLDKAIDAAAERRAAQNRNYINRIASQLNVSYEEAEARALEAKEKYGIPIKAFSQGDNCLKSDDSLAMYKNNKKKSLAVITKRVSEKSGLPPKVVGREFKRVKVFYDLRPMEYEDYRMWELDAEQEKLVPNIYLSYDLSHKYNTSKGIQMMLDKKLFVESFPELTKRDIWKNRDTSYEEFEEFIKRGDKKKIFVKQLDGSKAHGARIVDITEETDLKELYEELCALQTSVAEEYLVQHPYIAAFYPDALNTTRVTAICIDGKVEILYAYAKFATEGFVDNAEGRLAVEVDPKTGKALGPACEYFRDPHWLEVHPVTGKTFRDIQMPNWDMLVDVVTQAMLKYDDINFCGFDVVIRENDVILLEANSNPGLRTYQKMYLDPFVGKAPMFKKYL